MENNFRLVDIKPFSQFSESFSLAGNDYVFSHYLTDEVTEQRKENVRFDGVTTVLLLKGRLGVSISGEEYEMEPESIMVTTPTDVVSTRSLGGPVETYTLFLARDFLSAINFDLKVLNPRLHINTSRVQQLTSAQCRQLRDYLLLLHRCAIDNNNQSIENESLSRISRSINMNLATAFLYQIAYIMSARTITEQARIDSRQYNNRRTNYVYEFVRELEESFMTHRTVKYYADKLCITPKYLSIIVKSETGHSAAAHIDHYVINEAKNLLRFSALSIQQIAYKLNFPNQSAFGKYFKHLTGVSPSEFRAS